MAEIMEETFGDLLYKNERNDDCTSLPTPASLKYKILVKGKKLKKDLEEAEDDDGEVSDEDEADDIGEENKVREREERGEEREKGGGGRERKKGW